ncbi:putative reverse transcriptase domain-containing protein [Tanacetum coccineum]|uniref:Reverse transcriptase domain-containing protein n=1 Tax=Tanacetum coccineum TaxID=301880 RepID=A0ABQ5DNA3_9ASTR
MPYSMTSAFIRSIMAISLSQFLRDSSEDSLGTPAGRVFLCKSDPFLRIHHPIHIHLLLVLTFLSSADDTTDSDTPNTPPSPTHGTPLTKITSSTQRSPVIPRRRFMILAHGQPIPHGRPYPYHLSGLVHMMTTRKRVRPLPVQQLVVRHFVHHSSSDDSAQDSSSDSSSEASSDFHSDASSDSSSRHSLPDHSSPDLPSTSTETSHKRRRSPMTSVPALPPIAGALSPVHADLIPSPKRIRSPESATDLEGCSEDSFEPYVPREVGLGVDIEDESSEQSRSRGTDIAVDDDVKTGMRDLIVVSDDGVTPPVVPEVIPQPAQEGAARGTYETLGDLVQRFYDHTQAIPIHSIQVIEGVQREQGHRIVGVESIMPNTRSRASMTQEEVEELVARRVAKEMKARDGGNRNEGNEENRNGNGGRNENGNRNGNHGMNYGGFMPVARECTFQDFLKCKPHNFSGTEGVVELTRWFEKMETVFNICNCPSKYQVKYATCTLQDSALTWWNSHKRTIGVDAAYAMKWAGLMKLMTEVYCPRNEIQKMETKLWNLTMKGNDLTAYTQRFQKLILLCTRMVPDEEDKVERFIGGLPDNIQGNVIAANPARLQKVAYNLANLSNGSFSLIGKKWADFVSQSIVTQMVSKSCEDLGSLVIKSIVILSHFHSGIAGCTNSPDGLWCPALTFAHVKHLLTYVATSAFILGHLLGIIVNRLKSGSYKVKSGRHS